MDKRVMIIFAATMLLLMLAQQFLVKPQQPRIRRRRRTRRQRDSGLRSRRGFSAAASSASASCAYGRVGARRQPATVQAASESTTVVENDLYRITFTNRGGLVKSWILKKYTDDSGQPLDLVHQPAAAQYGYPLSLWTWDEGLRQQLNSALYVAQRERRTATAKDLSFEYADGDLVVKKEFHFDQSYVVGSEDQRARGRKLCDGAAGVARGIRRRHRERALAAEIRQHQRTADLRRSADGLRSHRRRREAAEAGQEGQLDQRRTGGDGQLPVGGRVGCLFRRGLPARAAAERRLCRAAQSDRDSQEIRRIRRARRPRRKWWAWPRAA